MRKFISRIKKYRVKNLFLIVVLASLLVTIISSYSVTYAKYSESASATGSVDAAKWVFKLNGSTTASQTITLASTTASYGNTAVVPGSVGTVDLVIDYSEMETSFTYTVTLGSTNLPTNFAIYTDDTYTTLLSSNDITKTITVDQFDASYEETVTLYWKWVDNDKDGDEDNLWEDGTNGDLSFGLTVGAVQYIS